jgi:hypothetical protein
MDMMFGEKVILKGCGAYGDNDAYFEAVEGVPEYFMPNGITHFEKKFPMSRIQEWFGERIFPKGRPDEDKILKQLGLDVYNEWEIIKKTHGSSFNDPYWLRFDEDEKFEECSGYAMSGYEPPTW